MAKLVASSAPPSCVYPFDDAGHELPTAVLLDLNLPWVEDLDVLRRIRTDARTRLLPVVVLTISKEQEDIIKSYLFGANSYVRKLVNFAEFSTTATQLGVYRLGVNELPPLER